MRHLARGVGQSNPEQWFNDNRVNIPGKKEVIWEPLYDSVAVSAAGGETLTLFQDQIGKAGKTLSDTNMDLDGQLSKGTAFLVTSIQLAFYPGGTSAIVGAAMGRQTANDVKDFYQSGSLSFRIQSKEYLRQAPFGKFPPAERIAASAAQFGQNATQNYFQYGVACGRIFSIRNLLLESNQNFSITLAETGALSSGIDGRVVCTLNGYRARNAQ